MAGYQPLNIKAYETGLVQSREEFILPVDAFPTLENAYIFRERIKRKQGYKLLGRLRRILTAQALGSTDGSGNLTVDLRALFSLEPNSEIEVGSVVVTNGANTLTDNSLGVLVGVPSGTGTINYATNELTITGGTALTPTTVSFNYFPLLPVMGLCSRELNSINNEMLIAFDMKYAYRFTAGGWQEFIPGTTWTGTNSDFFWSTNYWVDGLTSNRKLFWVTNASGTSGDPIRYTNGITWTDFAPEITAGGDKLTQCLAMAPFRGRLVVFNTLEGATLGTSVSHTNRIRWAAIGSPIVADAWYDNVRGKGGFLDIPTTESITSIGFVRDNLVIYCERSTWQLRYTGRSIQPFQIEKVNTELGADSTFSAVQFDTSLVGIGDKGVVECDSFKSQRIDIKIPDLVIESFNNDNEGPKRVHGIRDFQKRVAYWTYPYKPHRGIFPDRRLVYNYENDSWAIFTDSLTTLGTYQAQLSRRWRDVTSPWSSQNTQWVSKPALFPSIVGGNQQGFVEELDSQVTNDPSLTITAITGNTPDATIIESPHHNLQNGQVIKITGIPAGSSYDNLNDGIFAIFKLSSANTDEFYIFKYNEDDEVFSTPQVDPLGTYPGGGLISVRDNFRIVSKKFNAMDDGEKIQVGYIDVLMSSTSSGAITLKVYLDYNDTQPINQLPQNSENDSFFNATIPTSGNDFTMSDASKYWQRVFCATRGQFITVEYTLSNAQMNGIEQESNVQIDAQILWSRNAGRLA